MQRSQIALGLLLTFGLTLRFVLSWSHPGDLLSDNDGYLAHAKPVAAGEGFHGPWSHRPTAFRPPGYPVLLGGLMACGFSDSAAVAIVSLASCLAIILLTRTLALQFGIDERWSLLAVLGVAVDPLLLRYSILPMTEVPCAAILLAAIVTFEKFLSGYAVSDRHSVWWGIFAGVLFGIGTLIRPVVMVVCVFLTVYAIGRKWKFGSSRTPSSASESKGLFRSVLSAILPVFFAGLVLCPWIIRNAVQFHRFIPATTHGGYTLALGNNSDFYRDVINGADEFPWDGPSLDAWQQRMIRESEGQGIFATDEPAADAWYYSKASAAIQADPQSFLKANVLRLRRFWAIATADPSPRTSISNRLIMVWYLVLWAGLIWQMIQDCFGLNRTEHGSRIMLWLVIVAFLVMHSVYWTDTRMRAPVMPIMIVISVAGWQSVSTYFIGRAVTGKT